jgi:hypothetical protein
MASPYSGSIPCITANKPVAHPLDYPTLTVDNSTTKFLNALWRNNECAHFISIRDPKNRIFRNIQVGTVAIAAQLANEHSNRGIDVYFACSEYKTTESRKENNVAGAHALWFDIDVGEDKAAANKGYRTIKKTEQALIAFCVTTGIPMPTHIVLSGGGLHAYWVLTERLDSQEWKLIASKFKLLAKAQGFLADPSRTSDSASVLRVPGTHNHKTGEPRPVTLKTSSDQYIDQTMMLDAINCAHEKFCNPTKLKSTQASVAVDEIYQELDLEKLTSALKVSDPDCDEFTWKLHHMAVLAGLARENTYLHDQLYELAKDWSSGKLAGKPAKAWTTPGSSNGRTGAEIFDEIWSRFVNKPPTGKCATVGTIYFHAKEAGWEYQNPKNYPVPSPGLAARNAESFEVIDASVQKMSPLQSVQQQFCLINMEGRLWTLDLQTHNAISTKRTARKLVVSNLTDGTLLVRRALRGLGVDGDASFKTSHEFFNNPQTVCYGGIEFNPASTTNNYLNLWVGPTLVPQPGGWILIREFLLQIICDNDQEAFEYLIHFIAHALQYPEIKPGVMIILMGGQGIGKGTLGKILQLVWSATYWQIYKIDDVTGNFNASLERAFIVFLDEALFVGDRKASNALKSLVTEPIIQINEKYQPARQTRSYHRFFAATNAEHFKNTEHDDRRDFVLKVSEAKKGDHAYWSAVNAEIVHGGSAAMMHDLLAMDISRFNVRAKPSTTALIDQKLLSLGLIERWWYDVLVQGGLSSELGWSDFIPTTELIEAVMEFSGGKVFRKPSPIEAVKTMKRICPSVTNKQQQCTLERHRGLALPSLEQARREFEQYIGGAVIWESDEEL